MNYLRDELRAEALAMAGRTGDLALRASSYLTLYRDSGGNHIFPLLAAHGALWGSGHFRRNIAAARRFAGAVTLVGGDGAKLLQQCEALAEAMREINRRVCVETWFVYRLTDHPELARRTDALIPPALVDAMARLHAARRRGTRLPPAERRALFEAFFRWEQAAVVGPALTQAFARLNSRLVRYRAARPRIAFSYLPRPLPFRDFADTAERIEKGLAAFDAGDAIGWDTVEATLSRYEVLTPADAARPTAAIRAPRPVFAPAVC